MHRHIQLKIVTKFKLRTQSLCADTFYITTQTITQKIPLCRNVQVSKRIPITLLFSIMPLNLPATSHFVDRDVYRL